MVSCIQTSKKVKKKWVILTTTNILADTVKNIVKDEADVISLMGQGIDPHTYQVTQKDVLHLKQADVIIYNGLYLEGKITELLEKMAREGKVWAASEAIRKEQYIFEDIFPLGIDPHIWFDVQLWKQVVTYLSEQLQAARPEAAQYYQRNTVDYLAQLEQLHQEITSLIQSIPKEQRVLITSHDAFNYFGRAYGIEVNGLQGISTISECGIQDILRIKQIIKTRKVKAIFFETSVPKKYMQAIVEGCTEQSPPIAVKLIEDGIYSDSLGDPNSSSGTYCGMMKLNTLTIVHALQ